MKVAVSIALSPEERSELEKLARGRKVERARIVLPAAEGKQNRESICLPSRVLVP